MTTQKTKQGEKRQNGNNYLISALHRIGFTPIGVLFFIFVALLPLIPPFNQEYIRRWLVFGAYLAGQAVAFDFTAGYINVVNFGFAALLGLGAYTSAILASDLPIILIHPDLSPWLTIWLGAIFAGLVGLGLGFLTLRLRGIFAAVMAWFVGIALMGITNNLTDLTRGAQGLQVKPLLESTSNLPYFYIVLAMSLLIYILLKLITNSRFGLAFKAIGQNIEAARASGINPTLYRVMNFAVSCFFAGLLGGFYAHYIGILTPDLMHTSKTVEALAMAYIGGRGSLWGGMTVAFPFVFFIQNLRSNFTNLPGLHLVIYGILMILIMIFYPSGFAGLYNMIADKVKDLFRKGEDTESKALKG
ncbi:MAG: branched-chain amino acid ABC transporter permease [Anaerolineales bacterium]